jgi:hypothetical protein
MGTKQASDLVLCFRSPHKAARDLRRSALYAEGSAKEEARIDTLNLHNYHTTQTFCCREQSTRTINVELPYQEVEDDHPAARRQG